MFKQYMREREGERNSKSSLQGDIDRLGLLKSAENVQCVARLEQLVLEAALSVHDVGDDFAWRDQNKEEGNWVKKEEDKDQEKKKRNKIKNKNKKNKTYKKQEAQSEEQQQGKERQQEEQ